jgi:hypothetical protein
VGAGRRYYPPYAEAFGCEPLTASRGVWCVRKRAGFPGKLSLGSWVNSYCVGKPVTVRLVRLARWVSRGAGGATRRAPHAGRLGSQRRTGA